MSRMPNGLKKHSGGWWSSPYMRRSPAAELSRRPVAVPTPEEMQKQQADREAFDARFLAELEANRGPAKIKDREARAAVEGNTDINHDNMEEPVVSPEWVEVGGYVDPPEAPAGYSVEIRVDHLGVVAAYRVVRASE